MLTFRQLFKKNVDKKPYRKGFNLSNYRNFHYSSGGKTVVTVVPGDGIGPEVTASAIGIMQAVGAPVEFERFDHITELPQELITRYISITILA